MTFQFGITPLSIALTCRIEICWTNTSLENKRHHHHHHHHQFIRGDNGESKLKMESLSGLGSGRSPHHKKTSQQNNPKHPAVGAKWQLYPRLSALLPQEDRAERECQAGQGASWQGRAAGPSPSVCGEEFTPCSSIQWTIGQFQHTHPNLGIREEPLTVLHLYNFEPFHTGYLHHIFEHIFCFFRLPNRIGSDFFRTGDCLERTEKKITK